MNLDDEIRIALERPGELFRRQRRDLTRGPPEEMSFRIMRRVRNKTAITRRRVGFVQRARRARRVDADVGVVDDLRIAGAELEASHEARRRDRQRQHEDAEHIRASGLQRVRGRRRDDQIRRAELPARSRSAARGRRLGPWAGRGGWPRRMRRVAAFGSPFLRPAL